MQTWEKHDRQVEIRKETVQERVEVKKELSFLKKTDQEVSLQEVRDKHWDKKIKIQKKHLTLDKSRKQLIKKLN